MYPGPRFQKQWDDWLIWRRHMIRSFLNRVNNGYISKFMQKKKLSGLFSKAVLVLILISIVPIVIIGYHVMGVDSRVLKNEILQKQQTMAGRLSAVARGYINRKAQLFSLFVDLRTDFSGHQFITLQDLRYLSERDPSIAYLALLDIKGKKLFSVENTRNPINYEAVLPDILRVCVEEGEDYIGEVYQQPEGMFALLAFPVQKKGKETKVAGILVAQMNLKEMDGSLSQAYPLDMNAFVATATGKILSYNGAPEGLDTETQKELEEKVEAINVQLKGRNNGEVTLPDGKRILVARVSLMLPPWRVYVEQPSNVATQLFVESAFHSSWDVLILFIAMLVFVVVVSYWVIKPITRPLERLREAVIKQQQNEDFVVKKEELYIPNNEIGELALAFVEMSDTLYARRQELLRAQEELAHVNQELEQRVEERTRALKEASSELVKAERLAAIGQMASIISHEIRNPLAVISNATRLIKMLVPSPDPKLSKQFNIIEAEIKQANSIISEVLGYARTRDLILTTIDLNSYLRELILSYPVTPGITIREELDVENVQIKVDAEEIKQVIRNVISNAVEAMPKGGTLTVGTKTGRRLVCIYIADQGMGLTEEVRQKMFAPFFTTKARGTGLGLAVVRKAITRHRGKLFIKSSLGQGTCFQIYLKIYKKPGDTNYGEPS